MAVKNNASASLKKRKLFLESILNKVSPAQLKSAYKNLQKEDWDGDLKGTLTNMDAKGVFEYFEVKLKDDELFDRYLATLLKDVCSKEATKFYETLKKEVYAVLSQKDKKIIYSDDFLAVCFALQSIHQECGPENKFRWVYSKLLLELLDENYDTLTKNGKLLIPKKLAFCFDINEVANYLDNIDVPTADKKTIAALCVNKLNQDKFSSFSEKEKIQRMLGLSPASKKSAPIQKGSVSGNAISDPYLAKLVADYQSKKRNGDIGLNISVMIGTKYLRLLDKGKVDEAEQVLRGPGLIVYEVMDTLFDFYIFRKPDRKKAEEVMEIMLKEAKKRKEYSKNRFDGMKEYLGMINAQKKHVKMMNAVNPKKVAKKAVKKSSR